MGAAHTGGPRGVMQVAHRVVLPCPRFMCCPQCSHAHGGRRGGAHSHGPHGPCLRGTPAHKLRGYGARVKGMPTLPIPVHAPSSQGSPYPARAPLSAWAWPCLILVHGQGGHMLGPLPRSRAPLPSMHQGWTRPRLGGKGSTRGVGAAPRRGGTCGNGKGRRLNPPCAPGLCTAWGAAGGAKGGHVPPPSCVQCSHSVPHNCARPSQSHPPDLHAGKLGG
jgi:hypothetical protein